MSIKSRLFSTGGRIGRKTYWKAIIPVLLFHYGAAVFVGYYGDVSDLGYSILIRVFGPALYLLSGWIALATFAKRWHDIGYSGWLALTSLVSLIGIAVLLYLDFASGALIPVEYIIFIVGYLGFIVEYISFIVEYLGFYGWLAFTSLISLIGIAILLYLGIASGLPVPNKHGDAPQKLEGPIRSYVRYIELVNYFFGRIAMYGIFAMIAVLLWSSVSKLPGLSPSLWTLELAQFLMVSYYLLGGGYSMQMESHVRMDLLYGRWNSKRMGFADTITSFCLVFYLVLLLYGGFSSSEYAVKYGETSYSSWSPYMWPVKIVMTFGIFLMLLQTFATFIRDVAAARGMTINGKPLDEQAGEASS